MINCPFSRNSSKSNVGLTFNHSDRKIRFVTKKIKIKRTKKKKMHIFILSISFGCYTKKKNYRKMIQNNKIYSFASVTVTVTLHSNGLFLIQVLLFFFFFLRRWWFGFFIFFRLNKSLTGVRKVGRDPPTPRNKTFWGEDYLHFLHL